jgi:CDP-6-deoxy-D-xylo-4-hexulose-3-dehydrase
MKAWQKAIIDEWQERSRDTAIKSPSTAFPLIEQSFESDEILSMVEVLLSGQLTMAARVREFEQRFAEYSGAPYAVMVNSGSSANLLAVAVATNPMRKKRLVAGDEILVPAVCWSTSVWPLIQAGLKPVMVDVDPNTLNVDVESLRAKITPRTKGLMAVHILGNCAPMDAVLKLVREHNLIVIEDTCEGLGVRWRGKVLGTLGDMGTYSFYFSHHMTTGEGGMVVCQTLEDYDLLKCLRAHGWTRELSNRAEIEAKYTHVDPRFLFVNVGYNLRPMEIQAALGIKQLEKLPTMNRHRVENWHGLGAALKAHPQWRGQLEFPVAPSGAEPVWFGFPAILADTVASISLRDYLAGLSEQGVENRPVVSGNFARQPGLALFDCGVEWKAFKGAERVHQRGFFIGSHAQLLPNERLRDLAERLLRPLI